MEEFIRHLQQVVNSMGEPKERTVDSLVSRLLFCMSGSHALSGSVDPPEAFLRLTREESKNKEFSDSLKLVAQTLLGLFP